MGTGELRALRRIAAGYLGANVLVTLVGWFLLADQPLDVSPVALVPLAIAAVVRVPIRSLDRTPWRPLDEIVDPASIKQLARFMLFMRVAMAGSANVVGFAFGLASASKVPLLVGLCCGLVLFALWWPGDRFVEAVRRRVEPTGSAQLVDQVLRGSPP